MGATYHATAVVLRREPWRDSARLYTLYTREWGKLLAVGRGTAKATSKLGAHLEPFTLAEVHLAKGRRLETICGAILLRSPEALVGDEGRHAAVSFGVEALDHFVKWGERDERLWRLLDGFLDDLSSVAGDAALRLAAAFAWDLMDRLGYRPSLETCFSCRADVSFGGGLFLPAKGVIVCPACRPDERHLAGALPLCSEDLRALSRGREKGLSLLGQSPGGQSPAAVGASLSFLEAHLDRPLNSLPIVRAALKSTAENAKVPA